MEKPNRNWRGYLKEYAVIVIGVLTALGAQQAAEAVSDHRRASQARANIRAEIAFNLGNMVVRNDSEACVTKRLEETDALIAAMVAGKLPQDVLWIGRPIATIGRDGQYKAASEAGSVSLLENEEQAAYAYLYKTFETYGQQQFSEQTAWADLRTLEKHPLPSPAMESLLRSALQQARTARWFLQASQQRALSAAADIGIRPESLPLYRPASICVPLHTPRAEAQKLVVQGRPGHFSRDEP